MKMKKLVALSMAAAMTLSMAAVSFADEAENSSGISCIDDLAGKKIGVQLGTTGDIYASDYEGDDAGTVIERYNKGNDAVMALKQGKIDCVIIDNEPAKAYVATNEGLVILDSAYAVEDYAACFAKDNTELVEKFNAALQTLIDYGTVAEIVG